MPCVLPSPAQSAIVLCALQQPSRAAHRLRTPPDCPVPAAPPGQLLPPPRPPRFHRTVDAPKLDVTINKIIALLDSVLADDQPSDDDDDDDYDVPPALSDCPQPPDSARDTDPHAPLLPDPRSAQPPNIEKELQTELSCEICFMLLYNPVTTPCQHTFCAKCLHRALDHSNLCPLCRDSLPGFSFFEDHPYNQTLETLLVTAFPSEYLARGDAIAAEEADARLDTPIFPRYRLMLRRCLEQDVPSFGMIMPARQGSGAGVAAAQTDYGTMLEVRSVQMLADGRSMVETWSTYRFRILERGTLDGYTVGRIERIDDVPDSPPSAHRALQRGPHGVLHQFSPAAPPRHRALGRPAPQQRLRRAPHRPRRLAYWVALVSPSTTLKKQSSSRSAVPTCASARGALDRAAQQQLVVYERVCNF
ncbi:PUA-like domain-containing protein [Mycena leptocephala]|nr:PUA-like domain-containing protein [Mycena leptocephala]